MSSARERDRLTHRLLKVQAEIARQDDKAIQDIIDLVMSESDFTEEDEPEIRKLTESLYRVSLGRLGDILFQLATLNVALALGGTADLGDETS